MQCILLDDYQDVGKKFADWDSISDRVSVRSITRYVPDQIELIEILQAAEIVVIMRERTAFSAELISKLPKLKLIVTTGMRNAAIDLQAAKKQEITVCGTATHAEPAVEMAWALMLGLARQVVQEANNFRQNGPWQSTVGTDFFGKTLGLVGVGKLGQKMAQIGAAFGMNVQGWSPNLTEERAKEAGVSLASSLDVLLASSDFISLHIVLGDTTRGLIGREQFAKMKNSAYFINTSRGPIVVEDALIAALRDKQIAGAGIDVFNVEPLPSKHSFRSMKNLLAMPHLGYVTSRNYQTFYSEAVEDISAWLQGDPVRVLL